MTSDAIYAKGIKAQMPHPILTRVFSEPTHKQVKMVIHKLSDNLMALSCPWGHSKGHLGLLQDPATYLACNGEAFNIPQIHKLNLQPTLLSQLAPQQQNARGTDCHQCRCT
jgi:hypothetical protein